MNISLLNEESRAILEELQRDGRISYAELSSKTGIPSSTLHDKIKHMMADGIIKQFTILIDNDKIGLNHIAIIGVETDAKQYVNVAKELCELEKVVEIFGTTAEFDLMIKVRASSRSELGKLLSEIRNIDGIDDIFVSSILEVFKEDHTLPLSARRIRDPQDRGLTGGEDNVVLDVAQG